MPARTLEVARLELRRNLTRPIFWILIAMMTLVAWGLSTGDMKISSGDATVGGKKAFVTSEFAYAQIVAIFHFLILSMFLAVLAGLPVVRDEEAKVHEVLLATPMSAGDYVWGKFLGVFGVFLAVMLAHAGLSAFFNHVVPNADAAEFQGPFEVMNYLRPLIVLGLPGLLFVAAACFAIGSTTRKPILVFLFPVMLMVVCGLFLWNWSPSWLTDGWNRLLMLIDPSGVRWLQETYLSDDRGVEFYNHAPVALDASFATSRLVFVLTGVALIELTRRHFAMATRGATTAARRANLLNDAPLGVDEDGVPAAATTRPLGEISMSAKPVRFLAGALEVARSEVGWLLRHPGVYLFVPLIVIQVIGNAMIETGPFDLELLLSSGGLAVRSLDFLTLYGLFLILFYTVESLHRERSSGLASIHYATPLRTTSFLFGKLLGVAAVAAVLIGAVWLACVIALLIQGKVPIELGPPALIYGLVALPTFVLWCAFVTAAFAVTGNRMTCYAVGLGALGFTFYNIWFGDSMSWVWNWPVWGMIAWSDISRLEMNGQALMLNRLLAIAAAVFLIAVAARLFPRREPDAIRTLHRLRPMALLQSLWRLSPYAAAPLLIGGYLAYEVDRGFQGDSAMKAQKDYWRRNVRTFTDVVPPHIAGAEVALDLYPSERRLESRGHLLARNGTDEPMIQFAVTPGSHWRDVTWTLDDEPYEPEDRAGLLVVTPPSALQPGEQVKLGFDFHGHYPDGFTRNGGGQSEFVMPSGAVLTSFSPSFIPVLGYQESVGVDDENSYDAKEYRDDFHVGVTRNAFGGGPPYPVNTTISGPADWTLNGIGVITKDEVDGDRRTVTWVADHPVTFFNVVAGPLQVREGEGTAIYYNEQHPYNIDEMIEALDGARKYYAEWFHPFPWKHLKVTQFPAVANYAQGFASNISFSEAIGFLAKSDDRSNTAFMVTAHEAAHQWWGNILQPGEGPGGNILSEGMAHFSTVLLFEQIKGSYQARQFLKQIEERYGERRRADSERPLVKIDGSRPGDTTVTYDKGGWVFWMLLQHLGRERGLEGYRTFVDRFHASEDHPVLQDFVAVMREFADDVAAYDAFVDQWFFDVVLPEYKIRDASVVPMAMAASGDDATPMFEVKATIENTGTGVMPVEFAAAAGEEQPEPEEEGEEPPPPTWRDVRTTVTLGPGESAEVVLSCPFEPERILVDPDCVVLQLKRDNATEEL